MSGADPEGEMKYCRPGTVSECAELLAKEGYLAVAGCTDVLPLMTRRKLKPHALVDLTGLPGMNGIDVAGEGIRIGALATMAEIAESPILRERARCLAEAAGEVGSPLVRARATVGGNICNASPANDTGPALLVCDARLRLEGGDGERELALADFFRGVNETALRRGELLRSIELPPAPRGTGTAFVKIKRRMTLNISVVNASASLTFDDEKVLDAKLAVGSSAVTTVLIEAAREMIGQELAGGGLEDGELEGAIAEVSERAVDEVSPITDQRASDRYRREMVKVAARRALGKAAERAGKARNTGNTGNIGNTGRLEG